jgi:hypothetical protein
MVAIGDVNTQPLETYTRYDDKDPSIVYSGTPVSSGGTSFYLGTGTSMTKAGDTMTFTFTGSKIIVGVYGDSGAKFNVKIDGVDRGNYSAYGFGFNKTVVGFVDEKLEYGQHTIVVTALDYTVYGGTSQRVIIDYIDVGRPVTTGDRLTQPEEGWRRYDDSHALIKKEGSWTYYTALSESYNGGYQYSASGTIKFRFYGDRIRIIAAKGSGSSDSVLVDVDGETVSIDMYNSTAIPQRIVFEKIFDKKDFHNITLQNLNTQKNYGIDAIDINSDGRLYHEHEVDRVSDLVVGKRIRAHYRATTGLVGTFSGLGKETGDFINPAPTSTTNVDGDFYFILTEIGKTRKLVADRNIQVGTSWDTINKSGFVFGNDVDFVSIPPHTGETSSVGRAFANGYFTGAYPYYPWKAFDYKDRDSGGDLRWAVEGTSGYLGYEFNDPKAISSYSLMTFNDVTVTDWSTGMPKDWTFEGSDDGDNWSVLHTVTGMTNWVTRSRFTFRFDNKIPYKFYRINISSNNGGNYITIMEFNMSEYTSNNFTMRLLNGSSANSSALENSEWDRWIVNSDLAGTITPGDNNVWNWNKIWSLTSETQVTTTVTRRTVRGYDSVAGRSSIESNEVVTVNSGFRPVLEIVGQGAYLGHLFYFNGGYMRFEGSEWKLVSQELPDEDTFISNSHSSLSFLDRTTGNPIPLDTLPEDFEVVSIVYEGDLTGRSFSSKVVPPAQLIPASGDISIQGISHVTGFQVDATYEGSSRVLYVVSIDKGETWYSFKDGKFFEIQYSEEEISSKGMTTGELQTVTESQWRELIGESSTMRLAYYLETDSSTENVMVDELRLLYRMDGGWESPAQGEDYDYHYPTNEQLVIQVYSSGDYKVNYYNNQEEIEKPLWEEFDL